MLAVGIATGIYNNMSAVVAAVSYMGWTIQSVLKASLGIYSPSRIFEGFGQNLVEGMASGLGDTSQATDAMGAFGNDLAQEPFSPARGGDTYDNSTTTIIQVPVTAEAMRQYPNATTFAEEVQRILNNRFNRLGGGITTSG
jgi:hypothetical protein